MKLRDKRNQRMKDLCNDQKGVDNNPLRDDKSDCDSLEWIFAANQ